MQVINIIDPNYSLKDIVYTVNSLLTDTQS